MHIPDPHILLPLGCLCAAPPSAVDDSYLQSRDGITQVPGPGILANDTVPCPSDVEVVVVTPPRHGEVRDLGPDGSFTYVQELSERTNARKGSHQAARSRQTRATAVLQPDSFTYEITCPDTGLVRLSQLDNHSMWHSMQLPANRAAYTVCMTCLHLAL